MRQQAFLGKSREPAAMAGYPLGPASAPVKDLVERWRCEVDEPPPECRDPALCREVRGCAEGCNGEPRDDPACL